MITYLQFLIQLVDVHLHEIRRLQLFHQRQDKVIDAIDGFIHADHLRESIMPLVSKIPASVQHCLITLVDLVQFVLDGARHLGGALTEHLGGVAIDCVDAWAIALQIVVEYL